MVLSIVIVYELLSVVGVGLLIRVLAKRRGESEDFVTANRSLSAPVIGVTLGLTYLGSLHVFGVMELAWDIGFAAIWVSVAHVAMICVICLASGRWVRKLRVATVPQMIEQLFGKRVRVATSCANAMVVFGMLTMEAQAIGIVLSTLTPLSIQASAVIGGVIGLFYVLFAGMKEIGIINLINTVVMFSGLIVTGLTLGGYLPNGWEGVQAYYETSAQLDKLSVLGNPAVIIAFGIPTLISTVFSQGINQQGLQVMMAAKSERTVYKSLPWAAIINGSFTIFTVGIGVAALSIPELQALGAKVGGPMLIVNYLPPWLVAWLCAGFLGALLSTFATNVMAPATLFIKDIYVTCSGSKDSEAEQAKKIRITIVVLGVISIISSFFLPEMVAGANWLFSFLVPIFWVAVYGLFWKTSKKAAEVTLFGTWIINLIWSFTPLPAALGMEGVLNSYITLACSLVIGVVANLALPGGEALFKTMKAKKAEALAAAE
ncbi:MAG: sodium:solute symporter family protein [Clostridiales Family XIII bacterium]|jgi:SSS family solute:Na+ symporter|nr:sodium:solute symporter family protein [Clostridiales Family XIII bacterium]